MKNEGWGVKYVPLRYSFLPKSILMPSTNPIKAPIHADVNANTVPSNPSIHAAAWRVARVIIAMMQKSLCDISTVFIFLTPQ